jgi:hypothetical protein
MTIVIFSLKAIPIIMEQETYSKNITKKVNTVDLCTIYTDQYIIAVQLQLDLLLVLVLVLVYVRSLI